MAEAVARPTGADVAAYLRRPASADDDGYIAAAMEAQAAVCDTTVFTAGLRLAAIRRAARSLDARSAPSGSRDLGEFGSANLPRWDAEVERLEAPYRRGPFA